MRRNKVGSGQVVDQTKSELSADWREDIPRYGDQ
jgi:hypothetical protein